MSETNPEKLAIDATTAATDAEQAVQEIKDDVVAETPEAEAAYTADKALVTDTYQHAKTVLTGLGHTVQAAEEALKELWNEGLALIRKPTGA